MKKNRRRFVYFLLIIMTIIAGLASRHFANYLPEWNKAYLGDVLWALMVFFMIGFLFKRESSLWIGSAALIFSFLIEFSQLYQAHWINVIRSNKLGGLVLGYGFLWSDLVCYTAGIAFGVILEVYLLRKLLFIYKKY
jgi:hypothetical protein